MNASELSVTWARVSIFAAGVPVEQDYDADNQHDAPADDENERHCSSWATRINVRPISATHIARLTAATAIEKGRSLTS